MSNQSPWLDTQLTGLCDSHLRELQLPEQKVLAHQDVANDLQAFVEAAYTEGFEFSIASGFRDFQRQKAIWDGKFSGERPIQDSQGNPLDTKSLSPEQKLKAILRWSALPGGSRHHWGTDFDVYAKNHLPQDTQLQLEPWEYLTGHQKHFYVWLKENALRFGFFFPYQEDRGGVAVEPWHISHKSVSGRAATAFSEQVLSQVLLKHPIQGLDTVLERLNTIYTQYIINISTD
ncbi:D,D-carboxypeptidase family protein [Vibrio ishigakensis]|uniref:D,D-carboxypeptidase family protein n=1 Tax=Vibrio ishigakensis TaxID=1481914 RepID=A0A0B8P5D7_9VIBR|nr:D,D-carboxypeptidase family protein [Vibrio ishigakensis]